MGAARCGIHRYSKGVGIMGLACGCGHTPLTMKQNGGVVPKKELVISEFVAEFVSFV